LDQANQLSRTYVVLLDGLNRHPRQRPGGCAIVGMVGAGVGEIGLAAAKPNAPPGSGEMNLSPELRA
jgi:hypothetical protein